MWFECYCGHRIHDTSDAHYFKAHAVTDKRWFPFWNAIDKAIEEINAEDLPYGWFGVNAEHHITEAACIPIFTQAEACEMMRESEISN